MTVIDWSSSEMAASCVNSLPTAGAQATVLYLIDELDGIGGTERALLRVVQHLPRDKFRPLVATFRHVPTFPADALAAPLHVIPLRKTYDLGALRAARSLRSLIREQQVRITHCFFETADLWGGLVAKWAGCPILISSRRDMGIMTNWKHRFAYKVLGRMFDQVQTVSDQVRQLAITRDRLLPERVVTVHNGIDVEADEEVLTREEIRARLDIRAGSSIVVTLGNLRRIKGVEVLLRAAALVCRSHPGTVFLIVGDALDSGYLEELQQLAASLGISDYIRFWGPETRPARLLRACDVFALLSHSEGFSNAIVEAMASRLPCVVTDVGGNREAVFDGRNGFVVDRGDYQAAAGRIIKLIADDGARQRMGDAAFRVVEERFTTTAMISRLTACYEGLLRRAAQPKWMDRT